MKNLSILILMLVMVSCSTTKKKSDSDTAIEILDPIVVTPPEVLPEPPVIEGPNPGHVGEAPTYEEPIKVLPSATGEFTTNLEMLKCSDTHIKKSQEAAKLIKAIFNSENFKDEVKNFTYNGKKQFVDNGKMTNDQIYDHLMKGAEALRPTVNYQMDITIECYRANNSTVGYTYKSVNKVYANMKFHDKYDAALVASNTVHEWTHKMGFGHAVKWSNSRDYSVPYGMNKIVKKLAPLAKAGTLVKLK